MTKQKTALNALLSFAIMLCLAFGIGVNIAYAAEDNLLPTIVAIGGNKVQDGIGTLPSAIIGEPYKDKDGNNYKIVATGTAPFEYKSMILEAMQVCPQD